MLRGGGDDLALAVVWIDILPADDAAAAERARALLDDPRVTHFHDPERYAGQAFRRALGLGGVAWDVYLLYGPDAVWGDEVPAPSAWFHQLGGDVADPERRRTAHELAAALHEAGRDLGWPVATRAPDAGTWDAAREAALARLTGDGEDERCADCRAAGRSTSCSLGGWRRLVMRRGDGNTVMVSGTQEPSAADGRRVVWLELTGLECPECLLRAVAGLAAVDDVDEVEVRLADRRMRVLLAADEVLADEALVEAVRGQGFGAVVVAAP